MRDISSPLTFMLLLHKIKKLCCGFFDRQNMRSITCFRNLKILTLAAVINYFKLI